jgi:flagellar hook-associated protein 1 FlgK
MSLNAIMGNAASGLQTAQTALRVVSDNVANVDTPGYVRKVVDQSAVVAGGQGSGVSVQQVRNATDRFLQAATLTAGADTGKASILSNILDQAQSLFGDPSTSGSYFSTMDGVFSAFSSLSANPTTAGRAQALAQVSTFFNQSAALSTSLTQLSGQVDQRLNADVGKVNQLLSQIDGLNAEISRASATNGDSTGAQNQQSQLIDTLSSLMDVKVTALPSGGVIVRASDGTALAGDGSGPATLAYNGSGPNGQISVTSGTGVTQPLGARLTSGEVKGLLDLRNSELPSVQGQLSELTSGVADQLNAIHNAYSAVPPPTTLTSANTGLDAASAVSGFTGKTTIAEVNTTTNALTHRIDIDFDAGTINVDGGAAASFTPSTFISTLNTAMGAGGSASFTNGALTLSGATGTGLAIQDDATTPASNGGKGFSDYFGLNDLVSSSTLTNYNTGLTSADASNYPAGQTIKFRISDANGVAVQDVTVTTPAGTTMAALLGALNASPSGVGAYGAFNLDANGQMSFSANAGSGLSLAVVTDNTANTGTGASISKLFGIGDATRNARAGSFSVRSDLTAAPSGLALAKLNLAATPGTAVLATGDTTGADALGQAGTAVHSFSAAGGLAASSTGLSDYASNIAAAIARKAANADSASTQASAISTEASARRSSYEGVNLDSELVNLTTYQQAYNASARMVQAAKEMYDTLLSMVQ